MFECVICNFRLLFQFSKRYARTNALKYNFLNRISDIAFSCSTNVHSFMASGLRDFTWSLEGKTSITVNDDVFMFFDYSYIIQHFKVFISYFLGD